MLNFKKNKSLVVVVSIIVICGLVSIVGLGKAQQQKSEVAELTELATALGNADVFMAGLEYLSSSFGKTLGAIGSRFPNGIAVGSGASVGTAGSLTIGANGGAINELKSTTCNLSTTQLPLEATSTDIFYCAITGVASGDQVFVTLPSDNYQNEIFGGFVVNYAKASGTAGYIEVGIQNLTGNSTTTFAGVTTSVQVLYLDN